MRFAFAIAAAAAAVLVGSPSAAAVLDKHEPDEVVLAAGRRGHVAIGWTSSGRVAVAVRDPHGSIAGPWSVSDGDPVLLGLAVDGKGNLVVAWGVNDATTEGDSASAGCCRRLRVAVRPAGGRLGRPVSLSAPGADALGVLLRSTSHRTAIGWTTQPLDSSNASSVQLATALPGRRFAAPQTLALAHPQVLLAMAFTTRRSPDLVVRGGHDLFAVNAPAGLAPQIRPADIPSENPDAVSVAIARDGSSALLDDSGRPWVRTRASGRPWTAPVAFGEEGMADVDFSVLPGGKALVAWQSFADKPVHVARVAGGRVQARRTRPADHDDQGLLLHGKAYGQITTDGIYAAVDPGSGPLPPLRRVAPGPDGSTNADISAVPGNRIAVGWGDEHGVHVLVRRAPARRRLSSDRRL